MTPGLPRRRWAPAAVLAVFAVTFASLEVASYTRKSATWDEPIHLTAGYVALTRSDYRVDPSHPPFLRLWAALPLLAQDVRLDTGGIAREPGSDWLDHGAYAFAHQFMYRDNDADRLLYSARFMVVLLGILLGGLVFAWAYEWLGFEAAVFALVLYALSPNIVAHASLVTTDFGVTCFLFAAVYFLWRARTRVGPSNVVALAVSCALAVLTKFSGLVLGPILLVLLAAAVVSRTMTLRRAVGILAVVAAVTWAAIWACYGFHYAPSVSSSSLLTTADWTNGEPGGISGAVMLWADAHHLLPNAFTHGFLFGVSTAQSVAGFLAGQISTDGWWYYLPLAFVLKTPILLLTLLAGGLVVYGVRWRRLGPSNEAFVLVPVVIYVAVAIESGITLGVRHLLPIYPFVILIAVAGGRELMRVRAGRYALAALTIFTAVRFASVYPDMLTFFNQAVGGPERGREYLADSNLDWGQHLKLLKEWMDDRGVRRINLAYFGSADPGYYGIDCTYLPGGPSFAVDAIMRPQLPGYVAVSETVLSGVYLQPQWRLFYRPLVDQMPVAVLGNTIRIYWLTSWPEDAPTDGIASAEAAETERTLADALLFGMHWNDHAIVHYRRYLRRNPRSSEALGNLGLALAIGGRTDEAVENFRRAVVADPRNARVRRLLAAGLLSPQHAAEAEGHARKAVELAPGDAAAHDVLGRALAIQGRLEEAGAEFRRSAAIDPTLLDAREDLRRLERIRRR